MPSFGRTAHSFYFCGFLSFHMRTTLLTAAAILSMILSGCGGGKQIASARTGADAAYQSGNYQLALEYYEDVIRYYESEGNAAECPVYARASGAAGKLGMTEKAIQYLEADRYSNFKTADTWFDLAGLYSEVGNISKEIEALEEYLSRYPGAARENEVQARLFDIYMETQNWEYANEQWHRISADDQSMRIEDCFVFNRGLKNDHACDTLALSLLANDSQNPLALEWMGRKLFWQAEKLYQSEMKAYNENRTNKQYKQLLDALDTVTDDFKAALGYYKTLYEIDPRPEFAKYLGDIYNRLDDKQKADYYYSKAAGNQ